jgi:type II secretory pathway component PulC
MAQTSAQIGDRTIGALRPGVEAILLAAVALGCAQAGWEVMSPRYATAANPSPNDDMESAPAVTAEADFVSPFAPDGAGHDSASSAANAILSNLRVVGVRMAADPGRSGAILDQGGQHGAFTVGDDLGAGVELVAVQPNGIEVSIAGTRRLIAIEQQDSGPSFARAMMGLSPVDTAPQIAVAANEVEPVSATRISAIGGEAAWLSAAMGAMEYDATGAAVGWRVSAAAPAQMREAGLQPGDLVVAVNGQVPGAMASIDPQAPITLTVRRANAALATIRLEVGAPT